MVVAAWNEPSLLRACLRSLSDAIARAGRDCEVIVASPGGPQREALLTSEFPGFTHVIVSDLPTVPRLRKAGLVRARGDIVAFLEDHAAVAPEWAGAVAAGYDVEGCLALGGPVAQAAGLSSLDWGAYLFDYGRYAPPVVGGEVRELSGINMSFARALLEELGNALRDGVFEGALFEEIARRGIRPRLAPSAVVYHGKRYSLRPALVSVYYLGRGYAGRRVEADGYVTRLARAASSVLLPAVIVWRVLSAVLPKGRDTRRVLGSLGYVLLLALSWSMGECTGYLFGPADSDSRWR